MAGLRLIVGLGNPGTEYLRTRHNAGFWFVDALAAGQGERFGFDGKLHGETCKLRIGGEPVWLLKPATFMNKSGIAVASALRYYKIEPEQCLVAHDDLDLPAGAVRLKFDGGHGGQNGLRDIMAHLGHGKFHRLRLGIGHPGHKDQVTPWVLGRPSAKDEDAMLEGIAGALDVLPLAVDGQFDKAMQRLHTPAKR
ncbi:aminoacyl-tRNA hydrolase [Dyella flagellata]|uniref:Peptidyl-tRNA hydrolase n=1 Tax=Dyella flagellata TaxID=1867833 RepID=A0ABQ5XC85_9GAMM|nr:aminoacyl-tRNA hydrolase [Dyella flagellata]GLQ88816.1 peptidyl-tRNA hydrolase [Dyella flagellata]